MPEANIKKRLPRFQAAFEQAKGNRRKAEKILEDFLAQTDENAASPNVKDAEELLEQFYGANENYEKSIQLQTKLIKNLNPNVPPDKIRIGFRKTKIALDFYRSGKNTEADAMFAEGYQIYSTVPAENFKIEYHNLVAECFIYQKRYEKAKLILEELLAFFRENLPPNHGQTLEHKTIGKNRKSWERGQPVRRRSSEAMNGNRPEEASFKEMWRVSVERKRTRCPRSHFQKSLNWMVKNFLGFWRKS